LRYLVTKDGIVTKGDRVISLRPDKDGYLRFTWNENGKKTRKVVHRFVAQTYIPNPDNLPQVNHIDGDKTNNNVDNLEWCTQNHNMQHAIRTGLWKPYDRSKSWNRQAIIDSNRRRRKPCGI